MTIEEIAKKLYIKIDYTMRRKKIKRNFLAKQIGVKQGYMSDILIEMENGKMPLLKHLLAIQKVIGIDLIFFDLK